MTQPVTISTQDGIATVTIDNPPVNALSQAVRQGLAQAVQQTEADADVRAVVLLCTGRTFIAGADVREFGQAPQEPHLPDVIDMIEGAKKPWVAALHGTALGGGLEVALGCRFRLAVPSARLGLPEVNLGLIPGAGGTVRLPRLVGAPAALEMIAGGKMVSADKALSLGLVDRIVDGDLTQAALEFAKGEAQETTVEPLMARDVAQPDSDAWDAQKAAIAKRARGQNSPLAAITAVENALALPADQALAKERELFFQLKDDPQSLALRHIFFAERSAGKMPRLKGVKPRPIDKIGVIGGGTMGAGIVAACLLAGLRVVMLERDNDSLSAGQERVQNTLAQSHKRGLIDADALARMQGNFSGATDYSALGTADLVIEAVFEDMAVKKDVFTQLDAATKPDAVLATNTSYLDIAQIAEAVADPSRVLGLHFFSPAYIMKLLEIVHPPKVADDVLATGFALAKRLGKIAVPAGVCDGFIGNRIMSAYRRECDYMLEDGALPQDVDAAMRNFGFAMGIFAMQDMAGLDIAWAMRKRQAATRPADMRYVDIPDQLCELGRFGRKTGAGWYDYSSDPKGAPDALVEGIITKASADKGITRVPLSADEIMGRIIGVMQSEGRKILAEGIAQSPEAIDVVMVNGYGFPRWRGGPMFMAGME